MLEILITLVIVATALFGTAGMQINAMRMNKGAEFRTQAVLLASDMADRMEANKVAAIAGQYALPLTAAPNNPANNCLTGQCGSAALANWDLSQWGAAIASLSLPQARWQIIQTIAGNPSTYQIVISWEDRRSDTTYAAFDAASTVAVGITLDEKAERFFYTATRTIGCC